MPGEAGEVSGGHGGRETPVPIPNTEVKPACADGTWGETPWESRSPPEFYNDETAPAHRGGCLATGLIVVSALWVVVAGLLIPFGKINR